VLKQIATYGPKVIQDIGSYGRSAKVFGAYLNCTLWSKRRVSKRSLDHKLIADDKGRTEINAMTIVYDPVGLAKERGIAVYKNLSYLSRIRNIDLLAGYLQG
jgi:hypothetical protein